MRRLRSQRTIERFHPLFPYVGHTFCPPRLTACNNKLDEIVVVASTGLARLLPPCGWPTKMHCGPLPAEPIESHYRACAPSRLAHLAISQPQQWRWREQANAPSTGDANERMNIDLTPQAKEPKIETKREAILFFFVTKPKNAWNLICITEKWFSKNEKLRKISDLLQLLHHRFPRYFKSNR